VGQALTSGGDFSLRYDSRRVDASASYSLVVAKGYDEEKGRFTDLSSRVPHQVNLSAAWTAPVIETTFRLATNWNAPQLTGASMGSSGSSGRTPDFLMASLRISRFFFKERLEIYAGARNLLNNVHFLKGSDGETQEDYYGLRDGIIFFAGGCFKW
jgi:outer membrane receptor for ferrienterochelin and colicins